MHQLVPLHRTRCSCSSFLSSMEQSLKYNLQKFSEISHDEKKSVYICQNVFDSSILSPSAIARHPVTIGQIAESTTLTSRQPVLNEEKERVGAGLHLQLTTAFHVERNGWYNNANPLIHGANGRGSDGLLIDICR